MKNHITNIINYIERRKETNPRLFKILYYGLFLIAPIEMLCIKLCLFGYKKVKTYNNKTIKETYDTRR